MRIISQSKLWDGPYEAYEITASSYATLNYHVVRVDSPYIVDFGGVIGEYSTEERCMKIMEEIRAAYVSGKKVFEMPEE